MPRVTNSLAVLVAVLVVVAGCRTVTGRSAGQWIDDKTTTAKVKAAIASAQIGSMTRVDVDTNDGTVFLTGVTATEDERDRIMEAARGAASAKPVTSNLVLATAKRDDRAARTVQPAASPRTEVSSVATSPQTRLKFSRLEPETPSYARFAAYDRSGKRVATVFALPASELRTGIASLDTGERRIDHVSIYPGSSDTQYHVVLWHVNRQQARSLE